MKGFNSYHLKKTFKIILLVYKYLPIIELSIILVKTSESFTEIMKNIIAKTAYTINSPLIIPYITPPVLLSCLIRGSSASPCNTNLSNIKTNLKTINKTIGGILKIINLNIIIIIKF